MQIPAIPPKCQRVGTVFILVLEAKARKGLRVQIPPLTHFEIRNCVRTINNSMRTQRFKEDYEKVMGFLKQGYSKRRISKITGISRESILRWSRKKPNRFSIRITDEEIINACKSSSSMKQACEKLEMPFTSFMRRAKKLGTYETNQFWNKGKSTLSDSRIKSKFNSKEMFCENSTYPRSRLRKNVINEKLIKYQCSICGNEGEWLGKKLTLDLDHINGNHNDHRLENLRFVCPNCHSQTPSFRNKNGDNKKVTDDEIRNAVASTSTLRQALLKVGLSDGRNYNRIYKILSEDKKVKNEEG
jgi:5-methylcytosine-specific restriction endonuclease McrA